MITRGDDTRHDNCIDETTGHLTSRLLEDDGEGTGAGVALVKIGSVIGDVEADD